MAKIKTRSKSKLGLLIGILILSVALIFGTKLVKQNQENRSKAANSSPLICTSSVGVCQNPSTEEDADLDAIDSGLYVCKNGGKVNMNYKCPQDGYCCIKPTSEKTNNLCNLWVYDSAKKICRKSKGCWSSLKQCTDDPPGDTCYENETKCKVAHPTSKQHTFWVYDKKLGYCRLSKAWWNSLEECSASPPGDPCYVSSAACDAR